MDKRKERIKEIDRIRSELSKERAELYGQIYKEENTKDLAYRKTFIGKCFAVKDMRSNSYRNVVAFKILSLDEKQEDGSRAIGITICDEHFQRNQIASITKSYIYPFNDDTPTMVPRQNAKLVIDMFQEITNDEFNQMKNDYLNIIENA